MPAAVAIPLITAAASTGASIVGAKLSSNASKNAAKTQVDAANKSGELQAQSAREALDFQKAQAAEDARRFETTQRSNYDQWAARQGYQSTIGSMLGLPSRNIPGYQSSMPSGSPQGLPSGAPQGAGAPAGVDPTKGDIAGQVSAYFKARGVPDTETPYWVQKWSEFGQKDPAYFNQRLAAADIFGGGGGAPAAGAAKPAYVAPLSTLIPCRPSYQAQPLTAALQMPRASY